METKPFSLQSPEAIAKEYGGNKQSIARAAQMGLVDPTAAVLAGMFIDRMRGAAAQEQAPKQTVAQQVLSPQPQMAAGLGTTPQAQQMAAAAPTMPATQMPASEMAAPGMARGGIADLPVDESMFPDEYAGGGIVAFSDGNVVRDPYRYRPFSSAYAPISPEQAEEERKARESGLLGSLKYTGRRIFGPLFAGERLQDIVNRPTAANLTQADTAVKPDAVVPPTAVTPGPAASEDKALVTGEGAGVIPGQGLRLPAPPTGSSVDFIRGFLEGEPDKGTGERVGGYFQRSEGRERRLMEALGRDRLQGQAFGEYEKTLKKEGEQAGLDKQQAKYMALLKAGLSMMAGTSQHALVNIGRGALTGAEDYQTAFKDLRKAERERTKEFALIEQARRAEARDDLNRRDQLLMRASDAAQKRDDFGTQALLNAGIEDNRAARDIWKTQYAGGVQLSAAQIRANALAGRGTGLTAAQLGRFRQEAMRQIDQNTLRSQIAKELKLSKVPAPGADKSFDERVNNAYENEINKYVQRILGGGTTGGLSQGYSLLGTED